MKINNLLKILTVFLVISCGGGGDDDTPTGPVVGGPTGGTTGETEETGETGETGGSESAYLKDQVTFHIGNIVAGDL